MNYNRHQKNQYVEKFYNYYLPQKEMAIIPLP